MAEWWASLTSSVEKIALDIESSLVATAQAAQQDISAEQHKMQLEAASFSAGEGLLHSALLPWESLDESLSILSQDLMEAVLSLSHSEENFLSAPPHPEFSSVCFDLTSSVPVVLRLLQIDPALAAVHARLSPRMPEHLFWRHYFLRVAYLRAAAGMDGAAAKATLGSLPRHEVLGTQADRHTVARAAETAEDQEAPVSHSDRRRVRREEDTDLVAQVLAELADSDEAGTGSSKTVAAGSLFAKVDSPPSGSSRSSGQISSDYEDVHRTDGGADRVVGGVSAVADSDDLEEDADLEAQIARELEGASQDEDEDCNLDDFDEDLI